LPPPLRRVHQQLLRHFAATGAAPSPAQLAAIAADAGIDPHAAMAELAAQDLVAVDDGARLLAAYPFSPTPTDHVVDLGKVAVHAMCAIDALGIPAMLGADATIHSCDPYTGAPVTVTITAASAVFEPRTMVVVYAATHATGRSVDTCCSTINFFTDPGSAAAWIAARPGLATSVLDQAGALALGRDIFGPLLDTPATRAS
jgi:Alkylmercury lyase